MKVLLFGHCSQRMLVAERAETAKIYRHKHSEVENQ